MTPRSLLVLAPAAVAVAALAVPVVAAAPKRETAKDAAVAVQNFAFTPASAKISLGGTVTWTFKDPVAHTATDFANLGASGALWSSGPKSGNATFSQTFTAAGSWPYFCSIHTTMHGTVEVPMKFKPKKGGVGTAYTIIWATAAPAAGDVFDVQIRRPGSSTFVAWQTGVTTLSATFHPDAGTGSYQFQARVRKSSNGAATGFSAAKGIKVS